MTHQTPPHYAPVHRAGSALTRRRLLGLAALAALPAAGVAGHRLRTPETTARGTTPAGVDVPAATATPVPVPAGDGGPVPFRPGRAMLGAYLDLDGLSATQSLALRRRQLGRAEKIVHVFYGWADTLPTRIDGLEPGTVPMVSWRGTRHAGILDGSSDDLIARAARRLRDFNRPVLLRWAWEMNGRWYDWSAARYNNDDPSGYVRSWRRLHGIFAAEGADNVAWVWSPNWNSSPDTGWNQPAAFYPGDKYVDWVGVSGYNLNRENPETLFGGIYATYAATKPIIIAEVGAVDRGGRTKADWIDLFADWVRARPAVGAVTWFDTDTHPGYAERWRIDTSPESVAAYRAMARDPRFAG